MKKLFLVISSALLLSALTVTFNSCKKETPLNPDSVENLVDQEKNNGETTDPSFTGVFNAYEDCHNNKPYIFTIAPISSSEIKISNLGKLGFTVIANVGGSTFTIPTQQVSSNNITYTVSGNGYIDEDVSVHINHTVVTGSTTTSCNAICIR